MPGLEIADLDRPEERADVGLDAFFDDVGSRLLLSLEVYDILGKKIIASNTFDLRGRGLAGFDVADEIIWVWLLWNDGPSHGVEAALVLINVELPVAIEIS